MKNKTVNKKEIDKFSKLAREWWDPNGKFKPLHKFNPVRLDYIKKSILKKLKKRDDTYLKNVKILDIGCGGGLLCEPLTRLGAQVVGIDASNKNIKIAKIHAKKSGLKINYYCTTPENFNYKEKFDVVLNMEIVEHVEDVNQDLAADTTMSGCQIHRFLILHKELDPDDGEITRTRKVRRSFVAEKYDELVTALYKGDNEVSTKTEVTYEDGKKGYLEATLALVDAQTYMLKEKSDAA